MAPYRSRLLDAAIRLMEANGVGPTNDFRGVSAFLAEVDVVIEDVKSSVKQEPQRAQRTALKGQWGQDHNKRKRTT